MFNLGVSYDNGEGVAKDPAEALRWYHKAADAGNTDGMFKVGVLYDKGEGVTKDVAEALRWYRKAADAGNTHAMELLQAQQRLQELWDNCLILHDGRHVLVGDKPGEFSWLKSKTDLASLVKLTGADREEAEGLLRERQSRPGNIAARTAVPTHPTLSTSDVSVWANSYRNAKFITAAELLRQVGPVHLTIIASTGARRCVADPENLVRTSATAHGWKLVPEATDFELVVNADIHEGRIMTGNTSSMHSPGYIQIYTIWIDVTLRTKANCRRGDEFVRLTVFPYNESYHVSGSMSDPLHFTRNYKESFCLAMDNLFDAMGKRTDADDKDDEAAWTASLWPPGQDAEIAKNFFAPLQGETGGSEPVFRGISNVRLSWVHLLGEADKYINARTIEQAWENEMKTNGQIVDPSSSIGITHDIGTFWQGEPGFYVNASHNAVWQKGVVFNLNGELRRRTVCIWGGGSVDMVLSKQQTGPGDIANLTIRVTAKEFLVRR